MKVIRDLEKLNKLIKRLSRPVKSVGLVPTMGALHAGHLSLIKQARQDNDLLVVSIFVNPTQFGPQEDLKKYPRPLKNDLALCRQQKVDLVFLPEAKIMYGQDFSTFVQVEKLSNLLCGVTRPGHFRGVATVVAKLLNIVQPERLYLGRKDAQQAVVIQRMVRDLNFPVQIKILPTVREESGLALSSRNSYLSPSEKMQAQVLSKALGLANFLIAHGQRNAAVIIQRMKQLIAKKKAVKVDYIAIVDGEKLTALKKVEQNCLIALAARVGKVRLIDNMVIHRVADV